MKSTGTHIRNTNGNATEAAISSLFRPLFLFLNKIILVFLSVRCVGRAIYKFSSRILPVLAVRVRGVTIRTIVPLHQRATFDAVSEWETREPETLDWIDRFRPGAVFFDIGASFGNEALYAALKRNGCSIIVCWDTDFESSYDLSYNIVINKISCIENRFEAVSDFCGVLHSMELSNYYCVPERPKLDYLRKYIHATTIDMFVRERGIFPNYIKIDVDGAESQVIRGMAETLKHPAVLSVLVEINSDEARAFIDEFLNANGFCLTARGSGNPDNHLYERLSAECVS